MSVPCMGACSALGRRCEWPNRCGDLGRCAYGAQAPDAVISVPREPTPAMVAAGAEASKFYDLDSEPEATAKAIYRRMVNAARGVTEGDGYRTSANGLTRTKIAPDAAPPMVPSESVTLRMGADGRLHPPGVGGNDGR